MEALLLIAVLAYPTYRLIRFIRKRRYFASDDFRAHRAKIAAVVAEHNEIATYVSEIRNTGSFSLGSSSSGIHADLGSFEDTSRWNYKHDRKVANYSDPHVHNCSLQVVRNARADPLKYLMKYFKIKATEDRLTEVETLGEKIASLENALANLAWREQDIAQAINPPGFILKHYKREFMERIGVELSPITVPYPLYVFEYVSAGGNRSQKERIVLNTEVISARSSVVGC